MSGGQPHSRRLFFALWPDAAEQRALAQAFGSVVAQAGGRVVPAEQLHLTLEFLGPVPPAALAALEALGTGIALPDGAVLLDRIDWYRRAQVLVAEPTRPAPGLHAAQAALRKALSAQGFRVDARPFRPHVTLAREVLAPPPPAPAAGAAWRIAELALVESMTAPGG